MLAGLAVFFDTTCTIQKNTPTADAVGQMVDAWTDLAAHVGLTCRVAPVTATASQGRIPQPEMTVTTATHIFVLPGEYPSVTTEMRVAWGGSYYHVRAIVRDSEQLLTEVYAELVTT
jgi:head-tail adaptor